MGNKRKRRRFMKIELLETSAVGTPAYADAHFSFVKSLNNAYNHQLKGGHKEKKMAEKEIISEEVKEEVVEETVEAPVEEAKVEAPVEEAVAEVEAPAVQAEEPVAEEVAEEPVAEEAEMKSSKLDELITTLKEVINKMPIERALVETKSTAAVDLKSASTGELFLAMLTKK